MEDVWREMLAKGGRCWRLKEFRKENRERRENTRKGLFMSLPFAFFGFVRGFVFIAHRL
jgi:hypothetical protein